MAKNKIYKGMTKTAIAAVLASSLVAPSIAQAAEFDFYDATGVNQGNLQSILLDDLKFTNMILGVDSYKYELGGKAYQVTDVMNLLNQNPGLTIQDPTLAQKVTEAGLVGEEIPTQTLDIQSVKASTITILPSSDVDTATYKLALDYLDKEGNVIPAAQLPTDLTVSYVDNKDVFNTDGTIKNKDKIPASGSIKVVATVKSTAANINLTQEFEVTVVAANDWASVTDAKLVFNTDVTGTVAVVGDSIKLVPTVATKNDGTKLEGDTAPTDWSTQVKSVTSSNITVLTAAKSSNDISLTPITAGTATVTVELNSGYKFEKVITVNEEARQATKITAEQEKLTLSSTVSSGNVKVTVVDQYGDPVKGKTVYAYPTATGTKAIVSQAQTSATDEKGEATLSLTALGTATTGTDTFTATLIDRKVDQETGVYVFRARIPEDKILQITTRVTVTVSTPESSNLNVVPKVVLHQDNGNYVYVLRMDSEKHKYYVKRLEVTEYSQATPLEYSIIADFQDGDEVILSTTRTLEDGMQVRLK